MSFLRVRLFTLIYYLVLHLGFCKAYQNCLVAITKITTVFTEYVFREYNRQSTQRINIADSAHSDARKIAKKIEQTRLDDAGASEIST